MDYVTEVVPALISPQWMQKYRQSTMLLNLDRKTPYQPDLYMDNADHAPLVVML
jgi:hypothetical protein